MISDEVRMKNVWLLADLAREVGGEVRGDGEFRVQGLRTLDQAGPEDLSFLTRSAYRAQASESKAGALLVPPDYAEESRPLLIAEDPALALIRLIELLRLSVTSNSVAGIHPTAIIGADCEIDPSASIGPYSVLGDGCRIAADVEIQAHVVLGRGCVIGEGSVIHPQAVLYDHALIGHGCILHAGVVLGADGFGYTTRQGVHHKIPHAGRAVLEDQVEVGANSAIDRAILEETRIGAGSKIDNLVQVGHNVRTGRGCVLCGQVGIAGSIQLGDYVVMGGQSGAGSELGKSIQLGSGAQVAGKSAVFHNVEPGRKVGGIPAKDLKDWRRQVAVSSDLPSLRRRVRELERQLEESIPPAEPPAVQNLDEND